MTKMPTNPAGAPVVTCDLDEKCVHPDCDELLCDLQASLEDNPEASEVLAHYCGLDYVAKLHMPADQSEEE